MSEASDNKITQNNERERTLKEFYHVYSDLIDRADQSRWTRLNTLLVVSSIFTLAWATIYASSGTHLSFMRRFVLTAICVPGVLCGYWWSGLGCRTSKYLDEYINQILKIEERYKLPNDIKNPFILTKHIMEEAKTKQKHTTSRWLVTNVPIMFTALFVVLLCVTWKEFLIDIFVYLHLWNST